MNQSNEKHHDGDAPLLNPKHAPDIVHMTAFMFLAIRYMEATLERNAKGRPARWDVYHNKEELDQRVETYFRALPMD